MMKADIPPYWDQFDWPSLIKSARSGEHAALSEVFARLSSYCVLIAGKQLAVDLVPKVGVSDIAQKSLLEAFGTFPAFNGGSEAEIRNWLSRIVHHNVLDAARHYRDAQRRSVLQEQRFDADRAAAKVAGPFAPPSQALRRQEQDAELQRALDQLTEPQRRVVELRYREGLNHRQIAEFMELSEVAVRKLCSRAIETLRKLLATDDGPSFRSHN